MFGYLGEQRFLGFPDVTDTRRGEEVQILGRPVAEPLSYEGGASGQQETPTLRDGEEGSGYENLERREYIQRH